MLGELEVTPEAQDALVTLFRTFERIAGKRPSNALVFGTARALGVRFNDAEGKPLLSKFRKAHPGGTLAHPSSTPEIEHDYTSRTPAHPAPTGATRARDKVSPSSKDDRETTETTSPPSLPLRVDRRTAAERSADEAIALVRPRIEGALNGMTWTTWRSRNRPVVVDMVKTGMSPADIDLAHQLHSEGRARVTIAMRYVQEWVASQNAQPERQYDLLTVPARPE